MTDCLLVALITVLTAEAAVSLPAIPHKTCKRLSLRHSKIVEVGSVSELERAVASAEAGTAILLRDGVYPLSRPLTISKDRIAIVGKSGFRGRVVLTGKGMSGAGPGHILQISGSDCTVANLTLGWVRYHAIQIHGESGAMRPVMHNLHIMDCGQQLIKVSVGPGRKYSDGGVLACSRLQYTEHAPSGYTNGIDVLAGKDWIIRDNEFVRIRGPQGQLGGSAILCWKNSINTVVERNLIVDCHKGIAFGNPHPGTAYRRNAEARYDHQGGIVRNNIIVRTSDGDTGIEFNRARDFKCYHNTVYLVSSTVTWAIEYRFPETTGEIGHNLTNLQILRRDGAHAVLQHNITDARSDWFAALAAADLHLTGLAHPAIDGAPLLSIVADDFDGQQRGNDLRVDIGADER